MFIFLAALFTVYCSIRVVYVFLQWTCIRNGYLQYLVGVKHVSIFSDEPATLSLAQFGLAAVTFPESWLAGWTPDRADRTLTARLISLACGGRGGERTCSCTDTCPEHTDRNKHTGLHVPISYWTGQAPNPDSLGT